jgi:WD40 repeat protein
MPGVIDERSSSAQRATSLSPLWVSSLDESAVSTAWSSTGEFLAAASASGSIYVFDLPNGRHVREWAGHQFGATQVAWHPQELLLASAGQDGKVRLWRTGADDAIETLDCGDEWVEHISWSPSGCYLATAAGRKLKLWDKEGRLVCAYPDHPNTIASLVWKNDSDELVSACYGKVQFWRPEKPESHRTFFWKGSMLSLAWSPDGRYLCHGNQDATVHFWVVKSGKELQMWGYPTKVRELAWNHHSRYLATGGGSSVTVWDCSGKGPANTKPIELKHHTHPVTRLAYQRSGPLLASACGEGRVALWKPGKQKMPEATSRLPGSVTDLAWSPDDSLLAVAGEEGSLAVYSCP